MREQSLTAQVQAILRHDGPMDVFVIGLAAWHEQATATEFHYLCNNLRDLGTRIGCPSFKLPSQDLVIVCESNPDAVASGIEALEDAFGNAHGLMEDYSLESELFSLPADWEALRQRLRESAVNQLRDPTKHGFSTAARRSDGPPTPTDGSFGRDQQAVDNSRSSNSDQRTTLSPRPHYGHKISGPLTLNTLKAITEKLDGINFSNFISRQRSYRIQTDWQPLYTEQYSNLTLLQEKLFMNVTFDQEEPLFFELCRHLDRLMLITTLIERPSKNQTIGINLTGGIAATREFQQFDRGLSQIERSNIVVEIHWLDVLRDLNAGTGFLERLSLRGFKIALDRVGLDMLPLIDALDISVDYIKIIFDRSKLACLTQKQHARSLKALALNKLVLIGCDDELAFRFGQELGLTAYQGRMISQMAKSKASSRNEKIALWRDTLKSKSKRLKAA